MEDKLNPDRVEAAIKNLTPDTAVYQNLIDVLQKTEARVPTPEDGIARAVLESNGNGEAELEIDAREHTPRGALEIAADAREHTPVEQLELNAREHTPEEELEEAWDDEL